MIVLPPVCLCSFDFIAARFFLKEQSSSIGETGTGYWGMKVITTRAKN